MWKNAYARSKINDSKFIFVNIDHGVGILKINKSSRYQKSPGIEKKTFKDYINEFKPKLPIVNSAKALDFILN